MFKGQLPTEEFFNRIEKTFNDLKSYLLRSNSFQNKYKTELEAKGCMGYELIKYGSTVNGLATTQSSDLDLTFLIESK